MFRVETRRLVLRDWVAGDLEALRELAADADVRRFQTFLPVDDRAERWLDDAMAHNAEQPRRSYSLAIDRRDDAAFVGWVGVGPAIDGGHRGDHGIGYAILRQHRSHGYATEAVVAAVTLAFDSLGARVVAAVADERNRASARVLEKAGLVVVDREIARDGAVDVWYAIERERWRARG